VLWFLFIYCCNQGVVTKGYFSTIFLTECYLPTIFLTESHAWYSQSRLPTIFLTESEKCYSQSRLRVILGLNILFPVLGLGCRLFFLPERDTKLTFLDWESYPAEYFSTWESSLVLGFLFLVLGCRLIFFRLRILPSLLLMLACRLFF